MNGSTSNNRTIYLHHGPHVDLLVNDSVSQLAPYAGLILTIVLVLIFTLRLYIFEAFLMRWMYGEIYTNMDDQVRRGFVNHHMAGIIKIILLSAAAYPFVDVAFGNATLHSPFVTHHDKVKMGDVLVVCSQIFIGMYVFELLYRAKISPVSSLHHVGAIVIAQSAIAISLDFDHEVDATIEFILCFIWGKVSHVNIQWDQRLTADVADFKQVPLMSSPSFFHMWQSSFIEYIPQIIAF